ncbi:anaerobic ribonucleoside-triphosphate reductase activating protein [Serratia fonticola]|jgi:anaerobic ribonucleoside-triphosphate reductase activating protein|uniref:Anaerobic ribonucleoside-triphosphate reductase activating protein n=1 Tax=Serratia fonticola TaxID=47917 RepID=A0A542CWN3_SERFO|nr:4Fe-4S single cluster domain-containing protein [Serratia fonticola]TQI77812.1 anaerobic ribonucleoside-triphosphate reductase activating protein [Serratia fonticola]TQI95192.1 anaerobic ribonucleoside-triphosphate reductase activating protein [Serratia fonticola]TVZ69690.1 anaerobic ribonucleoside-triphosphate reductase activating protein [Serratia fonticola]
MAVGLSRLHFPVTTLGPGKRIGIWFQGCSIHCSGCLSPETWRFTRDKIAIEALVEQLRQWYPQADGITISGGEPFDQPQALGRLLSAIRQDFDGNILVFSGHTYAAITPHLNAMVGLIDALVSGPFEQDSPQTLKLRGSDNQILHLLTEVGKTCFSDFDRSLNDEEKVLDMTLDQQGRVSLIGIPRRDDLIRLRTLLEQQGHTFNPVTK